ncbi:hypothetical protein [Virgisporangium aurantiacum]|uniref:TIR domain-containing protein n=1 Tax=Virgisporangium aurantiacum TaxID=175570 RepID=A0A8J4E777_9ACTN|nr:hypothetical protein [Virgisporangium aurantiacum]GIJ64241.1 hypothetical protein Vau01_117570 [Virgisporangium aurantiacum]
MTGELYVCCARDGAAYVRKVVAHLRRSRVAATYDPKPPEVVEMDALRRRMSRTSALLIVMTDGSAASAPVLETIDQAEQAGMPIFGLLRQGRRPFRLNQYPYEDVTGGQLPTRDFVEALHAVAPATGSPTTDVIGPGPDRKWLPVVVGSALVILLLVAAGLWFTRGPEPPRPPISEPSATGIAGGTPSGTAGESPSGSARGAVVITSHHDGDAVGRCARIEGTADLDTGKTILFAKMRTNPPDATWYFGYVGSYRNGFVPPRWAGSMYFGTDTGQRYDLFVIVMDVSAAEGFWAEHKSTDGSFAFATAIPPGAERAAVVRLLQGSMDECR